MDLSKIDFSCVFKLQVDIPRQDDSHCAEKILTLVNKCVQLSKLTMNTLWTMKYFSLVNSAILNRLKILHLQSIISGTILQLDTHCHVLTKIRLEFLNVNVVAAVCQLITTNSQTLQGIFLFFRHNDTATEANSVVQVAHQCPHLTALVVRDLKLSTETLSVTTNLLLTNPRIILFVLSGKETENNLTVSFSFELLNNNHMMVYLSGWYQLVNDALGQGLANVLYAVPNIRHIQLSFCAGVSNQWLKQISTKLPHLRCFVVWMCKLDAWLPDLRNIFPQCVHVQNLKNIFPQCVHIQNDYDKWNFTSGKMEKCEKCNCYLK